MKKNIIKICGLLLFLVFISLIVVLVFGRTYDLKFRLNGSDNYEYEVESDTGDIEVLSSKVVHDNYVIKVKTKKPGKVYIYIFKFG